MAQITVGELIAKLSALDPSLPVSIGVERQGSEEIHPLNNLLITLSERSEPSEPSKLREIMERRLAKRTAVVQERDGKAVIVLRLPE